MRYGFAAFERRDWAWLPIRLAAFVAAHMLYALAMAGLGLWEGLPLGDPAWIAEAVVRSAVLGTLALVLAQRARHRPALFVLIGASSYAMGLVLLGAVSLAWRPHGWRMLPEAVWTFAGMGLAVGTLGASLVLGLHQAAKRGWWPEA